MQNKITKEFGLLSEISELLDNYKLKQIDVLGNEDSNSRYSEFWRLIKSGEIKNDKEAAQHFYQSDENNPNYKKFRLEYRERLINMVWHIDKFHPSYLELDAAYLACQEQLALTFVLSNNSCTKSVIVLLKEILEQSLKYELIDISFTVASRLRRIAANNTEDDKEFAKYSELCEQLEQAYYNEIKVSTYYDNVLSFYIRKRALQRAAFELGEKYLRELKPYFNKEASPKFIIGYSLIAVVKCISVADYRGLEEVSLQAIEFLSQKSFNIGRNLAIFLNQRILANRQLKRYDIALACLEQAEKMQQENTNNWFATKELSITLNLHIGNYQQAWTIFSKVKNSKGFKHLPEIRREDWLIIESYLVLLIKMGKIVGDFSDFKVTKILNSLEISERDKGGRNVAILILKIVFDIVNNQNDRLIEQVEVLSRYRSRYVKGDTEARAYLFIKLLGIYAHSGANRSLTWKESTNTFQILQEEDYNIDDQNHAMEVITFDKLWVLLMKPKSSSKDSQHCQLALA